MTSLQCLEVTRCVMSPTAQRDLISALRHCGELTELRLCIIRLNDEDLSIISDLMRDSKLPKLQFLNLDGNNLTNRMKLLLGDADHPGFPSREILSLASTECCAADLQHISQALQRQQLPKLTYLRISHGQDQEYQEAVRALRRSCEAQNCKVYEIDF